MNTPREDARRGNQVARRASQVCPTATWECQDQDPVNTAAARYRGMIEPPPSGDLAQLIQYIRVLGRNKLWILTSAVLGLVAGAAISEFKTPLYEAHAALEIQGTSEGLRDTWTSALTSSYAQNQARLFQSRSLIDRARKSVLLEEQLEGGGSQHVARKRLFGLLSPPSITLQDAVNAAAASVSVVSSSQHMVLDVSSSSPDPAIAAKFVNTLLDEYSDWSVEGRWDAYRRTSEWLVNAQKVLSQNLRTAEHNLLSYAASANLVLIPSADTEAGTGATISSERLRALQADLSQAQADRVLKESQLKIAVSSPAEAVGSLGGGGVADHYEVELADVRRQYAELTSELTPEHYRVKRVKAQLDTLEKGLQKQRETQAQALQLAYETALNRENTLHNEFMAQVGRVSAESEKLIRYDILKRELEVNRQLHDAILKRSEEASVDSALRVTNSRVVDQAEPSQEPFAPNAPLYAGIGTISGCLLGFMVVLARSSGDKTLRNPGESSAFLDMRELGAIPSAAEDESLRTRILPTNIFIRVQPSLPVRKRNADLPVWTHRGSATAEAFRGALASILSRGGSWSGINSLLVTSPGPAEGKTSVVSNLAIAFAEIRRKTLLIDADLRRPRIHEVFKVENAEGLATILAAGQHISAKSLVRETAIPGLSVLTAGPPAPDTAAAMLYSSRLEGVLHELKADYDIILIDTAPVLSFSDARLVSRFVDGVVLVLRAGKTTCDAAAASLQELRDDGAAVLGTILNDWSPKSDDSSPYRSAVSYQ